MHIFNVLLSKTLLKLAYTSIIKGCIMADKWASFYKHAKVESVRSNNDLGFTAEDLENVKEKLLNNAEKVSTAALVSKTSGNITAAELLKLTETRLNAVLKSPMNIQADKKSDAIAPVMESGTGLKRY